MKFLGKTKNRASNAKGFLTIDFLVAMTLAFGLILMTFALSTTLTVLQIAQYIAFSTSRAHAAGHNTQQQQTRLAQQKFESYLDEKRFPHLAPILRNGWFDVNPRTLEIRGGGENSSAHFNSDYGYQVGGVPQIGVRFRVKANILKLNLPLAGKIEQDDDFGTNITGFLIREPTTAECRKQMLSENRYRAIISLDGRFANNAHQENDYFPMEDNGC